MLTKQGCTFKLSRNLSINSGAWVFYSHQSQCLQSAAIHCSLRCFLFSIVIAHGIIFAIIQGICIRHSRSGWLWLPILISEDVSVADGSQQVAAVIRQRTRQHWSGNLPSAAKTLHASLAQATCCTQCIHLMHRWTSINGRQHGAAVTFTAHVPGIPAAIPCRVLACVCCGGAEAVTLMGDTSATCLLVWVSYTRTSPELFPAQMYSPLLVAAKPQASARPPRALHPGTCTHFYPLMHLNPSQVAAE